MKAQMTLIQSGCRGFSAMILSQDSALEQWIPLVPFLVRRNHLIYRSVILRYRVKATSLCPTNTSSVGLALTGSLDDMRFTFPKQW
jgi:hypothetical protein